MSVYVSNSLIQNTKLNKMLQTSNSPIACVTEKLPNLPRSVAMIHVKRIPSILKCFWVFATNCTQAFLSFVHLFVLFVRHPMIVLKANTSPLFSSAYSAGITEMVLAAFIIGEFCRRFYFFTNCAFFGFWNIFWCDGLISFLVLSATSLFTQFTSCKTINELRKVFRLSTSTASLFLNLGANLNPAFLLQLYSARTAIALVPFVLFFKVKFSNGLRLLTTSTLLCFRHRNPLSVSILLQFGGI